jgi:hypothetical protein
VARSDRAFRAALTVPKDEPLKREAELRWDREKNPKRKAG